jgi:hypothetical protein
MIKKNKKIIPQRTKGTKNIGTTVPKKIERYLQYFLQIENENRN